MKLREIRPIIKTRQWKETIAFYEQLGFNCNAYDEDWGWAALGRDDIEIMVALPQDNDRFEAPVFTGSFYFIVDNGIDGLWDAFRDKAKICYEPETFEYGMREFAIYDNNGYLLQFGESAL